MVIDPMEGNSNAHAQAWRARALLFPILNVDKHIDNDPEDFIHFITWDIFLKFYKYSGLPLSGNNKSDIDRVILPWIARQTCNKWK